MAPAVLRGVVQIAEQTPALRQREAAAKGEVHLAGEIDRPLRRDRISVRTRSLLAQQYQLQLTDLEDAAQRDEIGRLQSDVVLDFH